MGQKAVITLNCIVPFTPQNYKSGMITLVIDVEGSVPNVFDVSPLRDTPHPSIELSVDRKRSSHGLNRGTPWSIHSVSDHTSIASSRSGVTGRGRVMEERE